MIWQLLKFISSTISNYWILRKRHWSKHISKNLNIENKISCRVIVWSFYLSMKIIYIFMCIYLKSNRHSKLFFNLWKLISCFFYHFPLCPHFGSRANNTAKSEVPFVQIHIFLNVICAYYAAFLMQFSMWCLQINTFIISMLWSFLYLSLLLSHFSKTKINVTVNFNFF